MDTNENGVTLSRADAIIQRWGCETSKLFEANIKTEKPVDHICAGALAVGSTYFKAILLLLQNGFRMPAKALLRVLFELAVKLAWSLHVSDEEKAPDSLIEKKNRQWAKSSEKERHKVLSEIISIWPEEDIDNVRQRLQQSEEVLEALKDEKEMPNFRQLTEGLNVPGIKELYIRIYSMCNPDVHLDISSLGNRIRYDKNGIRVESDSREPIPDLIRKCFLVERMILYLVRTHYKWDTKQLLNDNL